MSTQLTFHYCTSFKPEKPSAKKKKDNQHSNSIKPLKQPTHFPLKTNSAPYEYDYFHPLRH